MNHRPEPHNIFGRRLPAAALVVCFTASLAAAAPHSWGAEYIVDAQSPRATDTNVGTRQAPLKTIGAAAKKVKPGDTVLVRPGTYREAVTLSVSGTPGRPITFQSEVPQGAVISGSDVVTQFQKEGAGVWSFAAPGIAKLTHGVNGEWIYINGSPLWPAPSREQIAPGTFWPDYAAQRVLLSPEQSSDIQTLRVEFARREGLIFPSEPLDDIIIRGFTLRHNADGFRGRAALNISGRRWVAENNHILWSSYLGVSIKRANACTLRNNVVDWAGNTCIGAGGLDLLVENNKFFHGNWRLFDAWDEGGGSKFALTLDSRVIGNEFAYHFGWGIWFDILNSGNLYQHNVLHDLSDAGIYTEISDHDMALDNVIYNCGMGVNIGESSGVLVRRNIIWNNVVGVNMRGRYTRENDSQRDNHAQFEAAFKAIPGISPLRVEQAMARYMVYWRAPKYFMTSNNLVWANLLFDNWSNLSDARDYASPKPEDVYLNNFSDYNIFYNGQPNTYLRGSTFKTLEEWQKASGRDAHSVVMNPRAPEAKLPQWAQAKRPQWDLPLMPSEKLRALPLNLYDTPMAQDVKARISRAREARELATGDERVKAWVFNHEGQQTLAFWLAPPTKERLGWKEPYTERRSLAVRVGVTKIKVEDGFGNRTEVAAPDGTLSLTATFVPKYIHGVAPDASATAAPQNAIP